MADHVTYRHPWKRATYEQVTAGNTKRMAQLKRAGWELVPAAERPAAASVTEEPRGDDDQG